ncbi:MAG: phytanoyl-CoA dioxygenase family protein [Chloroflexota bacterium]
MDIRFGYETFNYPSEALGHLRDSSALLGDQAALAERMQADGYLLMRQLISREAVLKARQTILEYMERMEALVPGTPILDGVMPIGGRSVPMMGRKGVAHHPDVLRIVEAPELFDFFETYFGEPAITYNYKWLRAVGNEEYTGAHYDFVYMGRGSNRLHTTWIPFGDVPVPQGTLAMCERSNHLDSFAPIRDTYGKMDVDRDLVEGWFTKNPIEIVQKFGGRWLTGDYQAGDVIVFGMHTMHASTTNLTNQFRISCDVRFQPASEPVDERWQKNGKGHTAQFKSVRPMDEARKEWGLS